MPQLQRTENRSHSQVGFKEDIASPIHITICLQPLKASWGFDWRHLCTIANIYNWKQWGNVFHFGKNWINPWFKKKKKGLAFCKAKSFLYISV